MRNPTIPIAGALALGLALTAPTGAATISTITLPEGNVILQITGALGIDTDGGPATFDTRTIYYFAPDFGDPQPNGHDFTGNTWPYVFVKGPLKIDPLITASITTANLGAGDFLLIDGNPVYQFAGDASPFDANGNFGPWFYIRPDGSATQSTVVPVPAAFPLFVTALLGLLGRSLVHRRGAACG